MQRVTKKYEKVEVLDIEIKQNRASTTYSTLTKLKLRYNFTQKPYLIIGEDHVKSLHQWFKYDFLKNEVVFVVANRLNFRHNHPHLKLDVNYDVCSTNLRLLPEVKNLPSLIAKEVISFYKEKHE